MKDTLKARAKALKGELTAVYYAYKDGRVGLLPKLIIGFTLLYALSPIDLIPDFVPVLGYLDDLLILPALIGLALKLIPREVMDDARAKAKAEPLSLKKNWTFAAVFILIWLLVAWLVVRAIAGL